VLKLKTGYFMEPNDRAEVRQMLTDIMEGHLQKIEGQYRLMTNQLSNIEIQTTKTNGRVTDLERNLKKLEKEVSEDLPHSIDGCPQGPTITELRDNMVTSRVIRNSIIVSITGASAILAMVWVVYKIFINPS
jgi:hypothetical protein